MARQIRIALLGQVTRAHGELEAERMVAQGLVALGLAWWLRQRTTAGRRWVSKRLWMGEESGVSKAIRLVKESRDGIIELIKAAAVEGLA